MDSECYLLVHVHAAIVDLVSGDGIHVFHVQAPHAANTALVSAAYQLRVFPARSHAAISGVQVEAVSSLSLVLCR